MLVVSSYQRWTILLVSLLALQWASFCFAFTPNPTTGSFQAKRNKIHSLNSLQAPSVKERSVALLGEKDQSLASRHEGDAHHKGGRLHEHTTDAPKQEEQSSDVTKIGSLSAPSVGIGTIAWSSDRFFSLENQELKNVVTSAVKSNGAFFDTAERYGSNAKKALGMGWGETEMLLAKLLEESKEDGEQNPHDHIIATKFTPTPWRNTAQSVVDACEQSRQRLGVEQIDLYQLHMPDIVQPFRAFGSKPKDEIYWDGLAECYHRGLVRNVGVSNYGPTLMMRCQEALAKRGVDLASNQISYSLIGRHNGAQETLDTCNDVGVQVLASFPFAMGLLTGKYTSDGLKSELMNTKKTMLEKADLMRYVEGDGLLVPKDGIKPLLKVMETIASHREKTIAQVALNYIVCKGAIPIPGARTKGQLEDNMGAMGWRLSKDEVDLLDAESDKLGFGFDGAGFKRTSEKFVGYGVEKWKLD